MNKGRKSILNAITALVQMAAVSVIGLVLTKSIIIYFGSEYNGINSSVNQIVNAIMILEGGFTLASNVALFHPFSEKDYQTVNGIVAATRKRFIMVGIIAVVCGIAVAAVYPLFVHSEMPGWLISAVMVTVLLPACFNLGIVMKYRVLILADQREYIISAITTVAYVIGTGIAIIAIHKGASLLIARIIIMFSLLANYVSIVLYCKKNYPWVRFDVEPLYEKIKGTKSVLVMKLTSMFYMSFPVIIISTLPENGAMLASVYAVYKSVTTVVGGAIGAFINAPRLGFGALFAEDRKDDAEVLFNQYEKITCLALSIVLGTTCMLIIPFVELYTIGVQDIRYTNNLMALLILMTVFFETVHIPSGQIIQMSGTFEPYRRIQSISCIVLVILMVLGRALFGLYGIVGAVLGTAILLAAMEIVYTGRRIFNRGITSFLVNVVPCGAICSCMTIIGFSGIIKSKSYAVFFMQGIVSVFAVTVVAVLLFSAVDFKGMKDLAKRIWLTLKKNT